MPPFLHSSIISVASVVKPCVVTTNIFVYSSTSKMLPPKIMKVALSGTYELSLLMINSWKWLEVVRIAWNVDKELIIFVNMNTHVHTHIYFITKNILNLKYLKNTTFFSTWIYITWCQKYIKFDILITNATISLYRSI